jgi:hypothetical protein
MHRELLGFRESEQDKFLVAIQGTRIPSVAEAASAKSAFNAAVDAVAPVAAPFQVYCRLVHPTSSV